MTENLSVRNRWTRYCISMIIVVEYARIAAIFLQITYWLGAETFSRTRTGASLKPDPKYHSSTRRLVRFVIASQLCTLLSSFLLWIRGQASMPCVGNPIIVSFLLGLQVVAHVLRHWSMRTLGNYFTRQLVLQTGQTVTTSGPYGLVRHPGYLANALCFFPFFILGPAASLQPWFGLLFIVGWCFNWRKRIAEEEELMESGDLAAAYKAYKRQVTARLLPGVWWSSFEVNEETQETSHR